MVQCQGLPERDCPNKSKNKHVKLCHGDSQLCSFCEHKRFGQLSSRSGGAKQKKMTKASKKEQTQEQLATEKSSGTKTSPKAGSKKKKNASKCKLCQKSDTESMIIII